MLKRILSVLSLVFGFALMACTAVAAVLSVPQSFEIRSIGVELLVELMADDRMRAYFLLFSVGLALGLTAIPLFLAPRRKKVAVLPDGPEVRDGLSVENAVVETHTIPPEPADLIRVFRSRIMATAFSNPGGRNRQWIIREAKVGDVVTCRSITRSFYDETDTVGIFSVKGEQMGLMDTALFYTICRQYPNHRMGIVVERVSGGDGIPYTCHIRVNIYRK